MPGVEAPACVISGDASRRSGRYSDRDGSRRGPEDRRALRDAAVRGGAAPKEALAQRLQEIRDSRRFSEGTAELGLGSTC